MPELVNLLYPWPVVSALASYLGVGDLLHLSRVNSEFRAVLHGFPRPKPQPKSSTPSPIYEDGMKDGVRPDIFVGLHQNSYWRHLKSTAHMSCAELGHRKGYHVGLCRYCSSPVCDACIVENHSLRKPVHGALELVTFAQTAGRLAIRIKAAILQNPLRREFRITFCLVMEIFADAPCMMDGSALVVAGASVRMRNRRECIVSARDV